MGKATKGFRRGAPTILTCLGALGVIGTAVKVAMDTPKALKLLEEAQNESSDELSVVEKVAVVVPVYVPSILLGVATIGCIFAANVLNKRKQASLASAYMILESSYRDYRRKVVEFYGNNADETVEQAVIEDRISKKEISAVSNGKILFYEPISDRFFESVIEDVQAAEYHLNRNFILRGEAYLNEFYDFLGLTPTDYGREIGWSADWGLAYYGYSWIDFNNFKKKFDDGTEYYIISMPFGPHSLDDEYAI